MDISQFDFTLPPSKIALHPATPRDSAKLLEVSGSCFYDHTVQSLPDLLEPGDLLVCNNTKVIPARVLLKDSSGQTVEFFFHKACADASQWCVFIRPSKKLQPGDHFELQGGFSLSIIEKKTFGEAVVQMNCPEGNTVYDYLSTFGNIPLPPYIRREQGPGPEDQADYQTIYAKIEGAVAAPTAGLHFTQALIDKLIQKGVKIDYITLHVGAGTFQPVRTQDITQHAMHSEYFEISESTATLINATKRAGKRVIAVGTTSLRALESVANEQGIVFAYQGETTLFAYPGYRFKIVDLLMTNFHTPKSTLLMLVSAFAGTQVIRDAYQHAINHNYRFYSYGDACLLHKQLSEVSL